MTSVFVTAATGQLGKLVVESLLPNVEDKSITLTISTRDAAKVPSEWTSKGVKAKVIDYQSSSEEWTEAFKGVERVLLISSSTIDHDARAKEHQHVIDAAKNVNVKLFAYTSILYADKVLLELAKAHNGTEQAVRAAGLPFVFLRNGWYTENYFLSAASWKQTGKLLSTAKQAKFSTAARKDYADAAAAVLRPSFKDVNKVYELAGDKPFTLDEFAERVSSHADYTLQHVSLPPDEYRNVLVTHAHVPAPLADVLIDADVNAEQKQALYTESKDLSTLIGRPTAPLDEVLSAFFSAQ